VGVGQWNRTSDRFSDPVQSKVAGMPMPPGARQKDFQPYSSLILAAASLLPSGRRQPSRNSTLFRPEEASCTTAAMAGAVPASARAKIGAEKDFM